MTEEELDQPATKRFVRDTIAEAAAPLATKVEMHQAIAEAIAPLATKVEMRQAIAEAIAPLATKQELQDAIAPLATKAELREGLSELRAEMHDGFARLMEAILAVQRSIRPAIDEAVRSATGITEEEWQRRVGVVDEKYKDLPPRVSSVEEDLAAHKQDFRLHKRPRVP